MPALFDIQTFRSDKMPDLAANMIAPAGGFPIQGLMMRYNVFVPRLYNWCKSLGFEAGKIMPSRAFCSDESQGYPIIMIAKHFGTFPFNHGRAGGMVATDRHGPHASHGQDMVIIQASHVGYDPQTQVFGAYRRLQTTEQECGASCGKIFNILEWYENEYLFACENVLLIRHDDQPCIIIDNQLIRQDRDEGLLLHLDNLILNGTDSQHSPIVNLSTARMFKASPRLVEKIGEAEFHSNKAIAIGRYLTADMFYYRHNIPDTEEGAYHLEYNLIRYMPQIITSAMPMLTAAQINTQIEFDRTFRTIAKNHSYEGKRVLFISGLNIDISPQAGQLFPLTKFVPWAAYLQNPDGSHFTMEQQELMEALARQSTDNPDQIDLEAAIQTMANAQEIKINF